MSSKAYELKNAYIGDCSERKPGANTKMYYPFKYDQLDKVGNSSIPITGTKQTIGYKFTSSATVNLTNPPTDCRFVSVWMKYISSQGDYSQTSSTYIGGVLYNFAHINSSYLKRFQYHSNSSSSETLAKYPVSNQANTSANQWYHLAYGTDGTKVYAYLNGDKIWEANITPGLYTNTAMTLMQMMECEMSEFIGEKVCWTAQEVQDYYNSTKDNYKPTQLQYIYNFDDGTWTNALLDSEGWVNGGTGLNASSSGLVFADTSTDKSGNRRKDFKVPTGWKRVTLYFKGVKSEAWGGVTGSLGTVWGDNTTHDFLCIRSNYYNPQNNGLMINGSWMQQLSYKSSVEGTATLDVENWTYTSTIDGSTKTGAVTQFNITENVFFYVSLGKGYYGTPSYIYKYHVTFEY